MNPSAAFIARPVATTLLTIAIVLAGLFGLARLPVAPLPQVDYPTITVLASMPGASPQTMAATVATPLERHLGIIAGITDMTSRSSVGSTQITLQFALNRAINGAARDVQAAINAARSDLPAGLPENPTYRKVNPADAPIAILAMTSHILSQSQIYDAAAAVLQQAFSQIEGIGQVVLRGSSPPAVRVEFDPLRLAKYGIGLEDVRAALASANARSPKGAIETGTGTGRRVFQLYANDQITQAKDYRHLIVAYRAGRPVQLTDVAQIVDSVEDASNLGLANGEPAVLVLLYRQPGANIIEVLDRVKAVLPRLEAAIPGAIDLRLTLDRTATIHSSVREVELTLVIAICLVTLVVFAFLGSPRAAAIPAVVVPVSLIGTCGAMGLLGYSLDNLSLMALTISTGFVVDDAIVVLENIARHIDRGMPSVAAALLGAREVVFTVLSMSLSLIAVFLPISLMGGMIGRLFREFAVTLSIAVIISLVLSLTTTPMMCARLLARRSRRSRRSASASAPIAPSRLAAQIFSRIVSQIFSRASEWYARSLRRILRRPGVTLMGLLAAFGIAVHLFIHIPKGFLPYQDNGLLWGGIQADESISSGFMAKKLAQAVDIVRTDPAVASADGFYYGGSYADLFVVLKPLAERQLSADAVASRLHPQLDGIEGAEVELQPAQDIHIGGYAGSGQYEYTLHADDADELHGWAPKVEAALRMLPQLSGVHLDHRERALAVNLAVDRVTAARLGLTMSQIDNTLYDAFGQRQVSVIYKARSQYHVVMEVAPQFRESPDMLKQIQVSTGAGAVGGAQGSQMPSGTVSATPPVIRTGMARAATVAMNIDDPARNAATNAIANAGGAAGAGRAVASTGPAVSTAPESMIPLSAIAQFRIAAAAHAIYHRGPSVADTISFNVKPDVPLGEATQAVEAAVARLPMPASIHGGFAGTAQAFQQELTNEPLLIASAVLAVYIVLGVLYESYIHPVTILATLPSAGIGAVLALIVCRMEFNIMALLGAVLLIGIVEKNAIIMIDFALSAERHQRILPHEAIFQAAVLRSRPIIMTSFAAMLGALPLAIGFGEGSELRRPLGVTIIGGLIVSQMLTLYATPVLYLYFHHLRLRFAAQNYRRRRRRQRQRRGRMPSQ